MIIDKQFLFIIGSPRSGTSWLHAMIGAHPLVCSTVELRLFSKYTAPWIHAWNEEAANVTQGRWHQGLPFLWTEKEFYDLLRDFLGKVYGRVVETNPQATHVLDKHPGYSEHVEDIARLVANSRFIHIIRDGRDVAVSMVSARRRMGFGTDAIWASAVEWKRCVLGAQKARLFGDRYIEIRYEDLLVAGEEVLKSVFDFCDLPASEEQVATIVSGHQFEIMKARGITPVANIQAPEGAYRKGKAGTWREELGPVQRYVFNEIAGDLLRELGYVEDAWWAESRSQMVILPILGALTKLRAGIALAARSFLGATLDQYASSFRSRIKYKNTRVSSNGTGSGSGDNRDYL